MSVLLASRPGPNYSSSVPLCSASVPGFLSVGWTPGSYSALLPADEQTLIGFSALLADTLSFSSIKVYLSAVRSLHIDNGLPDPLVNCLQLQCLLRGIKRVQGSANPLRLPITIELLRVIQQSLDMKNSDHVMLWEACCLGFFGFLWAGEFAVNSSFDPSVHLSIGDIQADSLVNPTCFKLHIKCSKKLTLSVRVVTFMWARALHLSVRLWL